MQDHTASIGLYDHLPLEQTPAFRQATQSFEDRLSLFFRSCSQQGRTYAARPWHWLPTLKQLAKYCGCSEAAMTRIASNRVKNINRETLEVLQAIACIAPPPYISSNVQTDTIAEMKARIADADRWLAQPERTRGTLMGTLLDGVKQRIHSAVIHAQDRN